MARKPNAATVILISAAALAALLAIRAWLRVERLTPDVVVNGVHSCELRRGGAVDCWGGNLFGELGNGHASLSMPIAGPVTGFPSPVIAVAAGENHNCAIESSGGVWCWGKNSAGQLGNNAVAPSSVPVDTGLRNATAVVAGASHSCALLSGGALWCWGSNQSGQFGSGTTGSGSRTPVATGITGVRRIASGLDFLCGIFSNGQVQCWGVGPLGSAVPQPSSPVLVQGLTDVVDLAASRDNACALIGDGTVKCWGSNGMSQLGRSGPSSDTPVTSYSLQTGQEASTKAIALGVGFNHVCVVIAGGDVKCWGGDALSELGNGWPAGLPRCGPLAQFCSPTPVTVVGVHSARDIASGGLHSCAMLNDDSVKCWGWNGSGQIGNGDAGGFMDEFPQAPFAVGVARAAIAAGGSDSAYSCALGPGGVLKCWGGNATGQLGAGLTTSSTPTPTAVTGLSDPFRLAAGPAHVCARFGGSLTAVDGVRCWGDNRFSELVLPANGPDMCGAGTAAAACSRVPAGAVLLDLSQVGVGTSFNCGVRSNALNGDIREAWCWGLNDHGQLGVPAAGLPTCGTPPVSCSQLPRRVQNLEPVAVAGGLFHACAVLRDATVACWGTNNEGQLGATSPTASSPVFVPTITSALSIASGSSHSCALLADRHVVCWGRNRRGQLGDSSTQNSATPLFVQGLSTAVAIAASGESTCALLEDGRIRCWGDNRFGILGLGSITGPDQCTSAINIGSGPCALVPVEVPGISSAVGIALSDVHMCAVLQDASLWCWGDNARGQLGRATTGTANLTPGRVIGW